MADHCEISDRSMAMMEKYPGYAADGIRSGVFTQKQIDECKASGEGYGSLSGRLTNMVSKIFSGEDQHPENAAKGPTHDTYNKLANVGLADQGSSLDTARQLSNKSGQALQAMGL